MENYEKIRVVGRGAYGIVHLCIRQFDKKQVIMKQIPVEQMTKDERQSALNEVKVLSMLDHPNIIKYYENFLEDKALMIVMEYAEGGTLFDYLNSRQGQLLSEKAIYKYIAQLLLAIQHVHSKQILHRDLKTQNILLDKKWKVIKIGDFGISKVLSSKSKEAITVVGTPCYISPELCEGRPYNQKSDIWALGCIFYELAALRRAFEAPNLPALVLKIMRGTFSPISDEYSQDLRQLVMCMLHLDPAKRPSISQIMSIPVLLNPLLNQFVDVGMIPCYRVKPPFGTFPQRQCSNSSQTTRGSDSCVFIWGGDILLPKKLLLISNDTQITQVSVGRLQKAGVTQTGRLLVWEGGEHSETFVPRYLEGQNAVTICKVACGALFTACLTDRGILLTFGSGADGCLGHGNFEDVRQAKIVEALLGAEIIDVACGSSHVVAVTNDHEVFVWGQGDNGRLGLNSFESYNLPQLIELQINVTNVYCGIDCTVLQAADGSLYGCGSNRFNKLSIDKPGNQIEESSTFMKVPVEDVKSVSIGTSHSAYICNRGICYTAGSNQFGQLGYTMAANSRQGYKPIESPMDVALVGCGDTFTIAVGNDGLVYSWGKSTRGRLGRDSGSENRPGLVKLNKEKSQAGTSLACGFSTTLLAMCTTAHTSR